MVVCHKRGSVSITRVGIGFAIPSDVVRSVVGQILHYGTVRRPWLGIIVRTAPPGSLGLFVVGVAPGSPAERAGLRPGDFLTAINGHRLHRTEELAAVLQHSPIGGRLVLTVVRGTSLVTLVTRLGVAPTVPGQRAANAKDGVHDGLAASIQRIALRRAQLGFHGIAHDVIVLSHYLLAGLLGRESLAA